MKVVKVVCGGKVSTGWRMDEKRGEKREKSIYNRTGWRRVELQRWA